jgi:hypothetical protein
MLTLQSSYRKVRLNPSLTITINLIQTKFFSIIHQCIEAAGYNISITKLNTSGIASRRKPCIWNSWLKLKLQIQTWNFKSYSAKYLNASALQLAYRLNIQCVPRLLWRAFSNSCYLELNNLLGFLLTGLEI